MVWRNAKIGDVLILRFKSPDAISDADLELQLTQSGNYGIVALSVNEGNEVTFDGYAPKIKVEKLKMSGIDIKKGWNTVRVRIKDKNPESSNYVFGLDYLKVN